MKTVATELTEQSRIADAAARRLRYMSLGRRVPADLLALADALEHSVRQLRQLASVGETREGGDE